PPRATPSPPSLLLLSRLRVTHALHSFPTRRSSDLHPAALDDPPPRPRRRDRAQPQRALTPAAEAGAARPRRTAPRRRRPAGDLRRADQTWPQPAGDRSEDERRGGRRRLRGTRLGRPRLPQRVRRPDPPSEDRRLR